jgi:hypothetical protein
MIKQVKIFDMDGTIVDSSHRYKTMQDGNGIEKIDLDFWRANEHRAFDDSLLPLAEQYKRDLADAETYVIIATARILRKADHRFIDEKLGKPDYIISRKENSNISGGLLKINGLKKFFNLKNFKLATWTFFEDNTQYLKAVCDYFKITGVYIPSNQGH